MSRSVRSLFEVLLANISNVLRETIKLLPISFIVYLVPHNFLAQSISWQITVIIFYITKFKVLFLTFSVSGDKTKLHWHWFPLVRQTLTTGENLKP